MAGKGGMMDGIKVGMRMFEVGMRFFNNLDKYGKNAEKIGKFFSKKEKPAVDVGMYVEKPTAKKSAPSNPLMDRMLTDKTFSEFLNQIFDKKTVFGSVPDSWTMQKSLVEKFEELEQYKTMGELRDEVKKLMKK